VITGSPREAAKLHPLAAERLNRGRQRSSRRIHQDEPDAKVTKLFTGSALEGVAAEKRSNQVDDLPGCDRIGKKPVEARAVVLGSEIEVIFSRSRANNADLGQVGFAGISSIAGLLASVTRK